MLYAACSINAIRHNNIKINMPDEILCYGNFCNRYQYVKTPKFVAYLKGTYDMTEDENVWSLVKKD